MDGQTQPSALEGHEMIDSVSPERRSEIMSLVRARDTGPEMKVRRLVHRMGFRYRLHVGALPGHPDLAFPSRRKVIFVHGCFWHAHRGCKLARIPKSRVEFWENKIAGNRERDRRNRRRLAKMGWRLLVIWECETGKIDLAARIKAFLEDS
jgi:DNA mismatch endonuclease (patch repair protein)